MERTCVAKKRFTDCDKWDDPWFMGLSPTTKTLWFYLLDRCDNAGVIAFNSRLAEVQIGATITGQHFKEIGDRIEALPGGKLWIKKFIQFQYGELKPDCRPHASVIETARKHGIKGYVKGIDTLQEKDKDKDKEKDLGGSKGGVVTPEEIYSAYPLKVGKPKALIAIVKAIGRGVGAVALLEKTKAFAASRNGDMSFCPHPATWFNQDRYNDDPKTWIRNENNAAINKGSGQRIVQPVKGSTAVGGF